MSSGHVPSINWTDVAPPLGAAFCVLDLRYRTATSAFPKVTKASTDVNKLRETMCAFWLLGIQKQLTCEWLCWIVCHCRSITSSCHYVILIRPVTPMTLHFACWVIWRVFYVCLPWYLSGLSVLLTISFFNVRLLRRYLPWSYAKSKCYSRVGYLIRLCTNSKRRHRQRSQLLNDRWSQRWALNQTAIFIGLCAKSDCVATWT